MDITRSTIGRISDDASKRDIPSFIEPRPPLILNPWMRPKPVKKTNLLELYEEEDSELEDLEFVQVYLRLKPCEVSSDLYQVTSDKCLIATLDKATAGHGRRTQHNVSKMYMFSHIFGPEATQKDIFEHVVKDNLRKLADGHSYTLLTYGASGSGKTFTLMGTVSSPGLVPRSLEYVFKVVDAAQQPLYKPSENGADLLNIAEQDHEMQWVKKLRHVSAPLRGKYHRMSAQLGADLTASQLDLTRRTRYYVWVSFVEIYNEAVYDLLVNCDRRSASKLRIREDPSGHVYVKGATQAFVRSGAEAYDVMVAGKHNLQVAATGVHARSSRSHCIFTITLLAHTDEGVKISMVRLCDLAGAERVVRTNNVGARLKESRAINASLHVLERCLHALRRRGKQPGLVPYRESKLTRLLGAGLSGARGSSVSMVVTVNPHPDLAPETRHVLQLAAVARDIQVNSTIETTLESSQDSTVCAGAAAAAADAMRLRADNERLHFELAQLQAQYRELLSLTEERQQQTAATMREIADEAKDMTRQYYEAQIAAIEMRHRSEIDEIIEEYESKLRSADVTILQKPASTPSRSDQKMIAQLTREIAILEEKLNVEKLARARAIEEAEHLRACIEERDHEKEKLSYENGSTNAEDVMLVDSDQSDDELNESLEPSFRKDNLYSKRESSQSRDNSKSDFESDDDSMLEPTPKNLKLDLTNTVNDKKSIDSETTVDTKDLTNVTANDNDSADSDTTIEPKESIDNTNSIQGKDTHSFNTAKDSMNETEISSVRDEDENRRLQEFEKEVEKALENNNVSDMDDVESRRIQESFERNVEKNMFHSIKTYVAVEKFHCSFNESALSKDETRGSEGDSKINVSFDGKNVGQISKNVLDKIKNGNPVKRDDSPSESLLQFEQVEREIAIKENEKRLEKVPEIRIHGADSSYELFDFGDTVTGTVKKAKIKIKEEIEDCEYKDVKDVFEPIPANVTKTPAKIVNDVEIKTNKKVVEEIPMVKNPKEINYDPEETRSPSIVNDEIPDDYKPSTINKIIGDCVKNKSEVAKRGTDSIDVFDNENSPIILNENKQISQTANESIIKGKDSVINESKVQELRSDKTLEDFEKLFENVSIIRSTEFDLLVTENNKETKKDEKKVRYNIKEDESKYNLRHKATEEQAAKTDVKTKKNLRLRRRKNDEEDKLKDIANLQKEFSDVTLGIPAKAKPVKDIPSPETTKGENCPPNLETMSCPSKRRPSPSPSRKEVPNMIITRSRRKLFTPRAEPLEESLPGGDSNERVCVPRPSYHRARTRRKL